MYNRRLAKSIVDALWIANDDHVHSFQDGGAFGPLADALKLVIGDKGYDQWVSSSELPDTVDKEFTTFWQVMKKRVEMRTFSNSDK